MYVFYSCMCCMYAAAAKSLQSSIAGGMGLIPGWGTKILHAAWGGVREH